MKTLKLTNSDRLVWIDSEDFDRCNAVTWYVNNAGVQRSYRVGYRTKTISLASFVMKRSVMFDHIDRDKFNNQKYNLRQCSVSLNAANRAKINRKCSSIYKGVSLTKKFYDNNNVKCWRAVVCKNGIRYNLGHFSTETEAARAYDIKAKELFGNFAVLNFP